MTNHSVVIAGGGPTGLMLAGELALAGVDVAVVERRPNQELSGARALGISSRTIEVLDQRGIADRFLSAGQTAQVTGFAVTRLDISDFPTRHNYGLGLRQKHIERILAGWVTELNVPILYGREITGFVQDGAGVIVTLAGGEQIHCRKLLIATGVIDNLPDIPGFAELFGVSVFHCPYCDGWEVRDRPLAIYGRGARGYGLSLELTAWSRDLVLCTDGPCEVNDEERGRLDRHGIRIREDRVVRLEGRDALERIVFASGEPLERHALFFTTGQSQQSHLAHGLGCEINEKGTVRTGKYEATHLPGLYVAGDASRAVQWVVVAAAEGAEAAFAINTDLLKEDLD